MWWDWWVKHVGPLTHMFNSPVYVMFCQGSVSFNFDSSYSEAKLFCLLYPEIPFLHSPFVRHHAHDIHHVKRSIWLARCEACRKDFLTSCKLKVCLWPYLTFGQTQCWWCYFGWPNRNCGGFIYLPLLQIYSCLDFIPSFPAAFILEALSSISCKNWLNSPKHINVVGGFYCIFFFALVNKLPH